MTQEQIRQRAEELFYENATIGGVDGYSCMFKSEAVQTLIIMGEWAAGWSDPDRPRVEKTAEGYKITYDGIDYQAKSGFISVMQPHKPDAQAMVYDMIKVINRHSLENHSNTPDYVLAAFLFQVLVAYGHAVKKRDEFNEAVMPTPFKSGGPVYKGPLHDALRYISEEGPERIITTPPDITDPATFKDNF